MEKTPHNMKFSFMTFSCPTATLEEVFELAERYGYDGIEPRASNGHAHGIELELGPAARRAVRDMAEDAGVEICCLAVSNRFADPATAAPNVEETQRFIDLAGDIGCPRLRVFGGNFPADVNREAATESLINALAALTPHGAARGVTLCLETHDAWTDARQVAGVLAAVNHPNVAANWDIMHPVRQSGYSMTEAYAALAPWIRHTHVHDGRKVGDKLEVVPIGTGDIDHRTALALLKGAHYEGYICGEWIQGSLAPEFFARHLGQEIRTLRALS